MATPPSSPRSLSDSNLLLLEKMETPKPPDDTSSSEEESQNSSIICQIPSQDSEEFINNLLNSCYYHQDPAWLDENGKTIGIIKRIWDWFIQLLGFESDIHRKFLRLLQKINTDQTENITSPDDGLETHLVNIGLLPKYHYDKIDYTISRIFEKIYPYKVRQNQEYPSSRLQKELVTYYARFSSAMENTRKHYNQLSLEKKLSVIMPSKEELLEKKLAEKIPNGTETRVRYKGCLYNEGNTCFANAALQTFFASNFAEKIVQENYRLQRRHDEPEYIWQSRQQILDHFQLLCEIMQNPSCDQDNFRIHYLTDMIWVNISIISTSGYEVFSNTEMVIPGRQLDPDEFLKHLFKLLDIPSYPVLVIEQEEKEHIQRNNARIEINASCTQKTEVDVLSSPILSLKKIPPSVSTTMQNILDEEFTLMTSSPEERQAALNEINASTVIFTKSTKKYLGVSEESLLPQNFYIVLNRRNPDGSKNITPIQNWNKEITLCYHEYTKTQSPSTEDTYAITNKYYKITLKPVAIICHNGTLLNTSSGGHYYTYKLVVNSENPQEKVWTLFDDARSDWVDKDVTHLDNSISPGHIASHAYCILYERKKTDSLEET